MTTTSPTLERLVARARSVAEVVAAGAARSEADRRLPTETVAAMDEAGMWSILTPSTHGGPEAGLQAQVETLLVTAEADPAAGWVQMVSNAHLWVAGSFPPDGQAEVFADGPSLVMPGTLAAQGRARRVDGGWRLTGRWQFASGVDHGRWLMMGAVAEERLAETGDRALHLIATTDEVEVDDTWHTLGLRGTGSKDLVADEAFVPDHRAMATRPLFDGLSPHGEGHRTHLNRVPVLVCLSIQLAAAVVGMGVGALRLHRERTAGRRDVYTGAAKAEAPGVAARLAETTTELDLARRLVVGAAVRCDRVGRDGERLTTDERAELKWHAAYAVELCRRAVDRIFAGAGAHAVYDDSPLQTRFRDLNTACHHAIVDLDANAELYGRVCLGLDPGTPLV